MGKQRILVVDDDEALGKLVLRRLRAAKYAAQWVGDGAAGLARIARELPDLLLLDHYLPDMTGEEFLVTLRADPATRTLPVILMTSDASRQRFRASMNSGADDFLTKPVEERELTAAVASCLRRHYWRMAPELGNAPASATEEVVRLAEALKAMEGKLAQAAHERWQAQLQVKMLNAGVGHRLHKQAGALESANEELKAYATAVAHELKRPLTGILGFADVLMEGQGGALPAESLPLLARIRDGGRRMAEFIDALFDMARAGNAPVDSEDVDLSALAAAVVEGIVETGQGTNAEIRIAPGMVANGDPVLLRIVLENLLSNAIKYSAKVAHPRVEFGVVPGTAPPEYFVHDNGAGFAMTGANRLFEPFQRLHTLDEFEGTGIGLATARRIIERHGGGIRADAAPGAGATFRFTLAGTD